MKRLILSLPNVLEGINAMDEAVCALVQAGHSGDVYVAIGCAHGKHRSVVVAAEISRLWDVEPNVTVQTIHMEQTSWASGVGSRVRLGWAESVGAWQPGWCGTWHPRIFSIS